MAGCNFRADSAGRRDAANVAGTLSTSPSLLWSIVEFRLHSVHFGGLPAQTTVRRPFMERALNKGASVGPICVYT